MMDRGDPIDGGIGFRWSSEIEIRGNPGMRHRRAGGRQIEAAVQRRHRLSGEVANEGKCRRSMWKCRTSKPFACRRTSSSISM